MFKKKEKKASSDIHISDELIQYHYSHMIPLEPRIVLDAAMGMTMDESHAEDHHELHWTDQPADAVPNLHDDDATAPDEPNDPSILPDTPENDGFSDSSDTPPIFPLPDAAGINADVTTLIVVDPRAPHADRLQQPTDDTTVVYTLNPDSDGLQQISTLLEQAEGIESLHIVPGETVDGGLLGNTQLQSDELMAHMSEVAAWTDALSSDAAICLNGALVSHTADGHDFARLLGDITGVTTLTQADALILETDMPLHNDDGLKSDPSDAAVPAVSPDAPESILESSANESLTDLVVIDTRIDNYETIVLTEAGQSGVDAVTASLEQAGETGTVRIFSHGDGGMFALGSDVVTTDTLSGELQSDIASWAGYLTEDADILVYGCNVAEDVDGIKLITRLAQITGADVAASDDPTGAADLGGDWELEEKIGEIADPVITEGMTLAEYKGLLNDTEPVNEPPRITVSAGTLDQGGTLTFSADQLNATDVDNDTAELIYTLTTLPTGGTLTLNGQAADIGDTVAQTDLDQLVYTHDGGETTTDSFTLSLSDGSGGTIDDITVDLTIEPVAPTNSQPPVPDNTAPVVADATLTIDENAENQTVSLTISDSENEPADIQVAISALPDVNEGYLSFNGTTITADNVDTLTITAADIDNGILTLTSTPSDEDQPASFSFDVTVTDQAVDGGEPLSDTATITVDVNPVNDAPEITVAPGTLDQGGTLTFSADQLNATDVDNDAAELIYTLTTLPTGGTLTLNGQAADIGDTVAQSDLDQLVYTHDGGETTTDSFTLSLSDGSGGTIDNITVDLTIEPVVPANTPPVVSDNTAPVVSDATLTIDENAANQTVSLTISDSESEPADIQVAISALPDVNEGYLSFDGTTITADNVDALTMTATDIDNGKLTLTSTPSNENQPASFSFDVTVTDQTVDGGEPLSDTATITVEVNPVNPEPADIVLIDTRIEGYDTIVQAYQDTATIVLMNADQSGVDLVTQSLQQAGETATVRIFSHGSRGVFAMGADVVNTDSVMDELHSDITVWSSYLTENADILVYGCNVAEGADGIELIENLAQVTGADIAASDDSTGATHLGGDWDLEVHIGDIDTESLEKDEVLTPLDITLDGATPIITVPSSTPSINEDTTLAFSGLDLTISDTDAGTSTLDITVEITNGSGTLWDDDISGNPLGSQGDLDGINNFLDNLVFDPGQDQNGTATITITVDDNTGNTTTNSFDITINPVSDAPVMTGNAALPAVAEDTTDPAGETISSLLAGKFSDVDNDTLAGIAISSDGSNSGTGDWEFKVSDGDWTKLSTLTINSTNALLLDTDAMLRFVPTADYNGTPDPLSIHVIDSSTVRSFSSTSGNQFITDGISGTDIDASAGQITTSITAVNDPFTNNSDNAISVAEGETVTLTSTDLSVSDPDLSSSQITYTITGISNEGTLKNGSTSLGFNATFTQHDIDNSNITFVHNGSESAGTTTIGYTVSGAGNDDLTDQTLTITVADTNSPPTVTVPDDPQIVNEDSVLTLSTDNGNVASFADVDAGSETVEATISAGHGIITLAGFTDATTPPSGLTLQSGTNGSDSITVQGSIADINTALDGMQYQGNEDFNGTDTITLSINDLGQTGAGGNQTADDTITVNVTPVDDAPLTGSASLAAIDEDTTDPAGATVTSLLSTYSDVDNDVLAGIAVSADASIAGQGTWQYSVNDGETWSDIGDVASDSALLLAADAKLRFLPAAEYSGAVGGLTIHAVDDSGGRIFTTAPASRQTTNVADAPDIDADGTILTTSVTAVNDPLEVDPDLDLTVSEGGTVTLTNTVLQVTDVEADATQVVYTITALPTAGQLKNGETVLDTTTNNTFTQDDIDNNRITFVHDGTEPSVTGTSLTVGYSVTDEVDGLGTSEDRTLTINVTPVNDAPELTVNAATVTQSTEATPGTLDFTTNILSVSDPDNTNAQLMFRIEALPSEGSLTINGAPVAVGSTFSYADVVAGTVVRYTHDEDSTATEDTFSVSLRDGAGGILGATGAPEGQTDPIPVTITIVPVNTAPAISGDQVWNSMDGTDTQIYLSLDEGETGVAVFPNTTFSDAETTETANLTVQILTLPDADEATLKYNGVAITQEAVDAEGGFTFSADNKGLLTIDHVSANEDDPPDVSFTIKVTDDDATPLSKNATINVEVQAVNDHPVGSAVSITIDEAEVVNLKTVEQQLLDATDVDTPDETLTFRLDNVPDHGYLFLDGIPLGEGATFTLGDIESERVQYQHDGSNMADDTFTVTLRDGEGGLYEEGFAKDLIVNFTIEDTVTNNDGADTAPSSGTPIGDNGSINPGGGTGTSNPDQDPVANPEQFVTNEDTPIDITESQLIANDSGDLPLNIISVQDAVDGTVALNGNTVTFTPSADFNGIATFTYTIEDASTGSTATATATVRVLTLAQNDPPVVTTGTQEYHTDDTTLFNEGEVVTVTNDALDTSDVDNLDSELVYTLTELPDKDLEPEQYDHPGTLYFDETSGTGIYNGGQLASDVQELRIGDTFTQADLDAGKIKFAHNGGETHVSTFKFTVTDGSDSVQSGTATLQDTPVNDTPYINQDYTVTEITVDRVVVNENDSKIIDNTYIKTHDVDKLVDGVTDADTLTLSITVLPTQGTLRLDSNGNGTFDTEITEDNKAVTTFTQAQIDAGRLQYVHGGGEISSDSFTVQVQDSSDEANDTATAVVNIGIVPFNDDPVYTFYKNSTIYEGQQETICCSDLFTADDVDNTDDQLQFRITDGVDHGQLIRLDVDGETLQDTGVVLSKYSVFTQAELNAGRIVYRHDGTQNLTDAFSYKISDAGGGEEPSGTLTINVNPINDTPTIEAPSTTFSGSEDQAIAITGITIGDPDSEDGSGNVDGSFTGLTATLSVASGTLSATASGSAGVNGDGTSGTPLTITGTLDEINATLASLTYTGNQNFVGDDTITITVQDNGNTGTDPDLTDEGEDLYNLTFATLPDDSDTNKTYETTTTTVAVTVNPVNDPPEVIDAPSSVSVNEDTDLVFSSAGGEIPRINLSDIDALDTDEITLTLSVSDLGDTDAALTFSTPTGLTFSNGSNGDSSFTVTGTKANIIAALNAGLTYRAPDNYHGSDTLSITVNDEGHTGLGGEKTDTHEITITVNPVNDAPTTEDAAFSVNEDTTLTFSLNSGSVDTNTNDTTDAVVDTYRIDTLPQNGTLQYHDGSTWVDVTENQEITNAQGENLQFVPNLNFNQSQGSVSFTFTAIDENNSESNSSTVTITVNAVNDAPEISGFGDSVSYTEGAGLQTQGTPVLLDADHDMQLVRDIELTEQNEDSFDSSTLTVQRSGGAISVDRFGIDTTTATSTAINDGYTLSLSNSDIKISGNPDGGTDYSTEATVATITKDSATDGQYRITFNADASKDAVSAVMKRITYSNVDDDLSGDITISFTFDDGNTGTQGATGPGSVTDTVTVNVINTNDSPSFSGGATITAREDYLQVDNPDASPDATDKNGETINSLLSSKFLDPDGSVGSGDSFAGIAITSNNSDSVQGTWTYSLNGTTWTAVGDVSVTNALFLDKDASLRFEPSQDANDSTLTQTPTLTVRAINNSVATTFTTDAASPVTANATGGGISPIASSGVDITASITAVNDPPEIYNLDDDAAFEEAVGVDVAGTAVLLDNTADTYMAAVLSDIELITNGEDDFAGATITVQNQTIPDTNDYYVIKTGEEITISGGFTEPSGQRVFNNGSAIRYNDGSTTTTVATITDNSVSSGVLTITFNEDATQAAVEAILHNLAFSNDDDTLQAGNKYVDITFTDGNSGAQGAGGALSTTATVTVDLIPTNDAPILSSGTTITTTEDTETTAQTFTALVGGENFSDPDGPSSFAGVALTGFDAAGLGTWYVDLDGSTGGENWVTLDSLNTSLGTISASNALLLSKDAQVKFVPDANANTAEGTTRPSLTVHGVETDEFTSDGFPALTFSITGTLQSYDTTDYDADTNSDGDTLESLVSGESVTIDVDIAERNDAPEFQDGSSSTITTGWSGTITESSVLGTGTPQQQLVPDGTTVYDLDLGTTETLTDTVFGAGTITVKLDAGYSTGDVFSLTSNDLDGIASVSGGSTSQLSITLEDTATITQVNAILQAIRFENTSDNPPTDARNYTITLSDGDNSDGTNTAGGLASEVNEADEALTATLTGSITITLANDPPTLSANGLNPTFTETDDTTTVALFNSADTDTIQEGQTLTELQLTVSNLSDGENEKLTIDGTEISLTDSASATTATNSGSVSVSVTDSTATITYTHGGLTETQTNTLVNGLAYRNTSEDPTDGNRVVTITSLTDSGSGTGDNDNTSESSDTDPVTIAATSTVNVVSVNDAPVLTATVGGTYTEGGSTLLFLTSVNLPTDVDADHFNGGYLKIEFNENNFHSGDTLQVVSGGNNITVSDTTISYDGNAIGTSSFDSGTGTLTVTFTSDHATFAAVQALAQQIGYSSSSENPTWAGTATDRAVTITLNDGGHSGTNDDGTTGTTTTASDSITGTFNVEGINDAPELTGLDTTSVTTYIQDGDPVVIDANAVLADLDLQALNENVAAGNWDGSTLTIARNEGARADDIFGGNGSLSSISEASGNIVVSDTTIGTYTNSSGTLKFTFNSNATTSSVNTALNSITYSNANTTAGGLDYDHVTLEITFDDQNSNDTTSGTQGSGQDQGSEGQKTVSGTITVNINRLPEAINDANEVNEGVTSTHTTATSGNVLTDATADSDDDIGTSGRTDALVITDVKDSSDQNFTTVTAATTSANGPTIQGSYGNLKIGADGSYLYTVDNTLNDVQALAVGEILEDTFTYQVHDGVGGYNTAELTITINGTNDTPVLEASELNGSMVSHYTFDGSITDAFGDDTVTEYDADAGVPSNATSTFGTDEIGSYWEWTANNERGGGFTVDANLTDTAEYSIALRFSFDEVSGYNKIIDYLDRTADTGFYIHNGKVNFYNLGTGSTTTYEANDVIDLIATRDAETDTFTVYVSDGFGGYIEELQVKDSEGQSKPFQVNDLARFGFFYDDSASATAEGTSGGKVYEIKIWDRALDAGEISSALDTNIELFETDAPLTTSGTMTVGDVDVTDVVTASYELTNVRGTSDRNDPAAPADNALTNMFSVTPITILDGTQASASLTWEFNSDTNTFDYLAEGESLILTYTVKATDDDTTHAYDTETVTIKITGTNDTPVITEGGDIANLDETDTTLTAIGNMIVTDLDTTETVAMSIESVALSGTFTSSGSTLPASLSNNSYQALREMLQLSATNPEVISELTADSSAGTIFNWTFTSGDSGDSAFDFLQENETLILTYTIKASDSSNDSVEDDFTTSTVQITITGTDDAPVINAIARTDLDEQTDISNLTATITANFTDVDLSDIDHTSQITVASAAGVVTGLPSEAAAREAALKELISVTNTAKISGNNTGSITLDFSAASTVFDYLQNAETVTLTYTVEVNDQDGGTATQTFAVEITGTNDAPTLNIVAAGIDEATDASAQDFSLSGTLDITDLDTGNTLTPSLVNATPTVVYSEGTIPGSENISALSAAGILTFNPTTISSDAGAQTIGWTYDPDAVDLDFLAAGETLTVTYQIKISDGDGGETTKDLVITITGQNDGPVVETTDIIGAVTELETPSDNITDNGTIAFSDLDLTDEHTVSAVIPSDGALGNLTVNVTTDTTDTGTGGVVTWNYSIAASAVEYLQEGEEKEETFTFNLLDGNGGSVERTVTVTITGTGDAPVVETTDVTGSITEMSNASGNLTDSGSINFSDVDVLDTHTVSAVTASPDALGSLTVLQVDPDTTNGTGGQIDWTYSVAAGAVEYLAAGETKVETFTFNLVDSDGSDTVERTVTVTIHGTNDTPTVTVSDGDSDGTIIAETTDTTSTDLEAIGTLSVEDLDTTDTVSVSVTSVATTDSTFSGSLPDELTNDTLKAMLSVNANDIIANNTTTGTINWSFDSAGTAFDFLPHDENLVLTYTLTVTDDNGITEPSGNNEVSSTTKTVTITITGTNDAPILTGTDIADQTSDDADSGISVATAAAFTDVDSGDTLTYSASSLPAGLTIDSSTGVISGTIDNSASQGGSSGAYTVTVTATDVSGAGVDKIFTWNVNNPAPTGTDDTADINEDGTTVSGNVITDTTADSDPDNDDLAVSAVRTGQESGIGTDGTIGNGLAGTYGTLTLNASGGYTYTVDNTNETVQALGAGDKIYDYFTYTVSDNEDGTDTAQLTVTINGVNDAPTSTNDEKTVLEDATTTLTLDDFGTYSDVDGTVIAGVKITSLETAGDLEYSADGTTWADVTLDQEITADDITNNRLRYRADLNANGDDYAAIGFKVSDGTAYSDSAYTLTVDVTAVNDAPDGADKTITIDEDGSHTFTAADFGFSDADDAETSAGADSLAYVKISSLPTAGTLQYNNGSWINVTENQEISVNDITNGKLRYSPADDANGNGYASFTFQVRDDGGTDNSGVDLDPVANTITIDVNPINDAPVASGTASLTDVAEDTTSPAGDTVANLFNSNFSDATDEVSGGSSADTFAGVAVTGYTADTDKGIWQYSTDGTNWSTLGTVSDNSALTLNTTAKLRFLPTADYNGDAPDLTVRLIDSSMTVANGATGVDVSTNGDTTAISAGTVTLSTSITAVNDAPENTVPDAQSVNEDGSLVFNSANGNLITVSDAADTDEPGATDMVETTVSVINGTLNATTGGEASITNNGSASVTISGTAAQVNAALNGLTYTPTADYNGSDTLTIATNDSGNTGTGETLTDTDTVAITVVSINNAPAGADKTITFLEDASYTLTIADFGFTDTTDEASNAGADSLEAVKISSLPDAGELRYDGIAITSTQVTNGYEVSAADISAGKLVFVPVENANGDGYTDFTFQVRDDGGTDNSGVDLDQSANTITFNVTPVNDAPDGADKTITVIEDASYTFQASDFGFTDTNDSPADSLSKVKISSVPGSGTLTLDGNPVSAGDFVTLAKLNESKLVFTPAENANGSGYTNFTFQVQDDGGTANSGVDLNPIANTITIDVTAQNDAPQATVRLHLMRSMKTIQTRMAYWSAHCLQPISMTPQIRSAAAPLPIPWPVSSLSETLRIRTREPGNTGMEIRGKQSAHEPFPTLWW
jgi:VCBS repeat-containing protein